MSTPVLTIHRIGLISRNGFSGAADAMRRAEGEALERDLLIFDALVEEYVDRLRERAGLDAEEPSTPATEPVPDITGLFGVTP